MWVLCNCEWQFDILHTYVLTSNVNAQIYKVQELYIGDIKLYIVELLGIWFCGGGVAMADDSSFVFPHLKFY